MGAKGLSAKRQPLFGVSRIEARGQLTTDAIAGIGLRTYLATLFCGIHDRTKLCWTTLAAGEQLL